MQVRNVNKEDLDYFKSLVEYKEYFESDNIWLKQSKVCIADNGDLLGFALIKPNSLFDLLGENIPEEKGAPEYMKWWFKEEAERLIDNHYEVLFYIKEIGDYYLSSDDIDSTDIQYKLSSTIKLDDDRFTIDALLWTRNKTPDLMCYNSFNDIVYYDITFID